ncbi:MAG TPA: class I SAM-dependent methyltransferase [Bryobacteraceae bacterium]|nr:class I SAM-dependent methyltransferase [Bryobacteraceae bacterium]
MTAYDRDLAYIHDTGFTGFIKKAAPGLLRLLRQNRILGGRVVDAGCGSGVWARELSERRYEVLGIDISAHMIRLARRQAPAAKFQIGSFLSAELPPCDAVTAIGECVNYAFDRRSGKKGLAEFFHRVHRALRPGGVFVFDIVEPGAVSEGTLQRKFLEGPDWAVLLEVREDRRRKTLTRQIASFRRMGKLYRRSEEIHRLHLYSGAELLAELSRAGFEARMLGGYGRFRFPRAHVGFLARKPC